MPFQTRLLVKKKEDLQREEAVSCVQIPLAELFISVLS